MDLAAQAVSERRAVAADGVPAGQWSVPVDHRGIGLVLARIDPRQPGGEHREVRVEQRLPGDGHRGDGLGLDSIDILELAMAIHRQFGVKTGSDDTQNREVYSNVSSLAKFILEQKAASA